MAVYHTLPDQETVDLLQRAMADYHPALHALQVRVQVIMADSDTDAPAVRHGGYPAVATIRVVSAKDRLTKGYDAEMLLSRADFVLFAEKHKLALLDHELCHLEPVKKKLPRRKGAKRGEPDEWVQQFDDLNRPKLRLRKGDWNPGDGFKEVVERHGDSADEFAALARAYAHASAAKETGELAREGS